MRSIQAQDLAFHLEDKRVYLEEFSRQQQSQYFLGHIETMMMIKRLANQLIQRGGTA